MTRAKTRVVEHHAAALTGSGAVLLPGGAPLHDVRRERFAQFLAIGKSQHKAYGDAGFAPNTRSAAKLANAPVILARVDFLRRKALAETELTIGRILDELEKIAFSNMLDYVRIENGQPVLDWSALTREQAAAIGEITTSETTSPRDGSITRSTKFKLLDKKGTLIDLGKYLGMFKEVKDINVKGIIFHMNADDMAL